MICKRVLAAPVIAERLTGGTAMYRRLMFVLPILLFAQAAQARQVTIIQPLALSAGQPVRITGMDLDFAPDMLTELQESDAKAARKRA